MKACNDCAYLILEIDILGTKARVRIGNQLEYFETGESDNPLKLKILSRKKEPFKYGHAPASLTKGVEHIIRCIEKKDKPLSTGKDAVNSIKIIESILKSSLVNVAKDI